MTMGIAMRFFFYLAMFFIIKSDCSHRMMKWPIEVFAQVSSWGYHLDGSSVWDTILVICCCQLTTLKLSGLSKLFFTLLLVD